MLPNVPHIKVSQVLHHAVTPSDHIVTTSDYFGNVRDQGGVGFLGAEARKGSLNLP